MAGFLVVLTATVGGRRCRPGCNFSGPRSFISGVTPSPSRRRSQASAASGYVCPADDAAEPFVVGVVVAPDDVPAGHAGLFLVAGVVGAVEREVAQGGELGLDPV